MQELYNMQKNLGFTLLELMIVLAIIGVLAVVAIPAYQIYATRAKISEAIIQGSHVKALVNETFIANGITYLPDIAQEYNSRSITEKQTRYVSNIHLADDGVITITITNQMNVGLPATVLGKTLVMTPNIGGVKLANTQGSIDWACASDSSATAVAKKLVADIGTLPSAYVPPECQ